MSGKGGVGKTSVATYLALGLAQRGYRVGLLDTDFHGPDTLRMLGITDGLRADNCDRLAPQKYNDNLGVVSIEGCSPTGIPPSSGAAQPNTEPSNSLWER